MTVARKIYIFSFLFAVIILCGTLSGIRLLHGTAKIEINQPVIAPTSAPIIVTPSPRPPSPRPSRTPFLFATNTFTPTHTLTSRPTHTLTPTATLPPEAKISNIYGYGQLLPLSCEARSAADWARYFKIEIREMDFMDRLPKSDDPEIGFVGSPFGSWGQIPPHPYGVHAGPVAAVLRSYGANALARRNLSWDALRSELASGRPVIVWVTGHVEPHQATQVVIGDVTRTVAPYEHTVILIGYDSKSVTILDGKKIYKRPIEVFLASWAPLENMAITWELYNFTNP